LLNGIITDREGRPVVPTYTSKGSRRYAFYETRKDLARPGNPPATRFQQGSLDRQGTTCIINFLADEHALRRVANLVDAARLFDSAQAVHARLTNPADCPVALRSLVIGIRVRSDHVEVDLDAATLGNPEQQRWTVQLPLPVRLLFREAKLSIDAASNRSGADPRPLRLIADAFDVQAMVFASPQLSLNQLAQREGRCRTNLARLLRISWSSPKIVEVIAGGTQPSPLSRKALLTTEILVGWAGQEKIFDLPT
jgi:site-specific DNA recombinase